MSERDKRFAIIGGTVLVAVLLLLFFRGKGAGGTVGSGGYTLPTVYGPSLGPIYNDGGSPTFIIPGLDLSGPNLNMVGACCSDCMQGGFTQQQGPQYISYNTYNMAAQNLTPAQQNFGTQSHYTSLTGVVTAWNQGDRVGTIGF